MHLFKRAFIAILRAPKKTFTLFLLVFILGNMLAGGILVQHAILNTEKNLRNSLPPVTTVDVDFETCARVLELEFGSCIHDEIPSLKVYRKIGALPYVRNYEVMSRAQFFSHDLVRHFVPNPEMGQDVDWASLSNKMNVQDLEWFWFKGGQNTKPIEMAEGIIELIKGRYFTEAEMADLSLVAMVSDRFAEANGLTIGSKMAFENLLSISNDLNRYSEEHILARHPFELEVVGIFSITSTVENSDFIIDDFHNENALENLIYVPNHVIEEATEQRLNLFKEVWPDTPPPSVEGMMWFVYNIFILYDPLDLQSFANAANDLLPEFYRIFDLSNVYADIAASMETLQFIASLIFWIAVGSSLVILSLLIILFLRDRKHEIGIYLALGERKRNIVSQILIEIMTISFITIGLSLFSGQMISNQLSRQLLERELINQQSEGNHLSGVVQSNLTWFAPAVMSAEEMQEAFDISLSLEIIVIFL